MGIKKRALASLLVFFSLASTMLFVLPSFAVNDPFCDFTSNCDASVDRVAYSPDGNSIAAAKSFEVLLWNIESGVPKKYRLSGGLSRYITAISYSANGDLLAAGDSLSQIFIWDVHTGSRLHRFKFTDRAYTDVGCIAFSSDGRFIAAAEGGNSTEIGKPVRNRIQIWNLSADKVIRDINGGPDPICCLAFEQGRRLVSVDCNGFVRAWETQSLDAKDIASPPSPSPPEVRTVNLHDRFEYASLSTDGRKLAVSGEAFKSGVEYPDGEINLEVGRPNFVLFPTVKVFDFYSGRLLSKIKFSEAVREVVFTPDGQGLIAACGSRIEIRDCESGNVLQTFNRKDDSDCASVFSSVASSPSGGQIVAGNLDRFLRVFCRDTQNLMKFRASVEVHSPR